MSAPGDDPAWLQMGVAAALCRQFESDQREFLPLIAQTLRSAFPDEVEVREQGWFSAKRIVGVLLNLPEEVFAIEDPGRGALRLTRKKVVRGIALKTEEMDPAEWVAFISEVLAQRARANVATRDALARLAGTI